MCQRSPNRGAFEGMERGIIPHKPRRKQRLTSSTAATVLINIFNNTYRLFVIILMYSFI